MKVAVGGTLATIAALLLAFQINGGEIGPGASVTPTPTPTASVSPTPTATPTPTPTPDPETWATPYCESGAVNVTTSAAVRTQALAGNDVCVTAAITSATDLDNVKTGVHIGTAPGASLDFISLIGSEGLTISARFCCTRADEAEDLTIDRSIIGGEENDRTDAQLIFIPNGSTNTTISNSDVGWTYVSDSSGNVGYGIRAYGPHVGLTIVNNRFHDIAADGLQIGAEDDTLIDRNEIGPVGANPGDHGEHSDSIQVVSPGTNFRITNNWIHHQGYYDGSPTDNAGAWYLHGDGGGGGGSVLFENNLVTASMGRVEVCGLGTGGTSRSNVTIRKNTFYDLGQWASSFPGFEWDCDSGSNNLIERNIAVDPDGGFVNNGSGGSVTLADNIFGTAAGTGVSFNGDLECTSSNCNPAGQDPIGYRKPEGVRW